MEDPTKPSESSADIRGRLETSNAERDASRAALRRLEAQMADAVVDKSAEEVAQLQARRRELRDDGERLDLLVAGLERRLARAIEREDREAFDRHRQEVDALVTEAREKWLPQYMAEAEKLAATVQRLKHVNDRIEAFNAEASRRRDSRRIANPEAEMFEPRQRVSFVIGTLMLPVPGSPRFYWPPHLGVSSGSAESQQPLAAESATKGS